MRFYLGEHLLPIQKNVDLCEVLNGLTKELQYDENNEETEECNKISNGGKNKILSKKKRRRKSSSKMI